MEAPSRVPTRRAPARGTNADKPSDSEDEYRRMASRHCAANARSRKAAANPGCFTPECAGAASAVSAIRGLTQDIVSRAGLPLRCAPRDAVPKHEAQFLRVLRVLCGWKFRGLYY